MTHRRIVLPSVGESPREEGREWAGGSPCLPESESQEQCYFHCPLLVGKEFIFLYPPRNFVKLECLRHSGNFINIHK